MTAGDRGQTAHSARGQDLGPRLAIALAVVAAFAGAACAQDSVSLTGGLPGDSVSAVSTGANSEQRNDFVVDLSALRSSWGGRYLIGPALKASAAPASGAGSGQFGQLIGAQAVSATFTEGPSARPAYLAWRAAGQGVSATHNSTPTDDGSGRFGTVIGPGHSAGTGSNFGLAFMEFGPGPNGLFGDGDDEQAVVTGLVSFQPTDPSRLFVSRVVAAVNKSSAAAGAISTASFGLGGVDSAGFTHLLADGFGMTSASALPDKRLYRVDAAARSASLNAISTSGATDTAASRLLLSTATPLSAPSIVPADIAARPVLVALDFAGNHQHEAVAGSLTAATTHLSAGESARGPMTLALGSGPFARLNPINNAVGVGAALVIAPATSRVRSIAAWGITASGAPIGGSAGRLRVDLPSAIGTLVDPTDGFDPAAGLPPGTLHEFTNYQSQVAFRGASGPVAAVVLQGGDLLLAASIATSGTSGVQPQGFDQAIVVARVSAATGSVTWSIVAHTGDSTGLTGKAILGDFGSDGILGTVDDGEDDGQVDRGPNAFIGRLGKLDASIPDSPSGPSLSSPALDRAGNVYFTAATQFKTGVGQPLRGTVALIRANYHAAEHRYELERLLEPGVVMQGANSQRPYRIESLSLADGDSIDSSAPSAASVVQNLHAGVDVATLPYADPRGLGAVAVRATILYDRDQDSTFRDPTIPGNASSPDEAYEVVLTLMPDAPRRTADFNGDGTVDPDDLSDYIACYFQSPPCPQADTNADGTTDPDDLSDYIALYFTP